MRIKIKTVWKAENKDGAVKQGRLPGQGGGCSAGLCRRERTFQVWAEPHCHSYRGGARFPRRDRPAPARALLALVGLTLWASDGGSLSGAITDPNGAAVPGAKITATETATAVKQTIITDRQGFYSFQSLSVGRYDVEVDASGFKPLRRTGW